MAEGGDREEDIIILRVVAHAIAILHHSSKWHEDVVANWNLKVARIAAKCTVFTLCLRSLYVHVHVYYIGMPITNLTSGDAIMQALCKGSILEDLGHLHSWLGGHNLETKQVTVDCLTRDCLYNSDTPPSVTCYFRTLSCLWSQLVTWLWLSLFSRASLYGLPLIWPFPHAW